MVSRNWSTKRTIEAIQFIYSEEEIKLLREFCKTSFVYFDKIGHNEGMKATLQINGHKVIIKEGQYLIKDILGNFLVISKEHFEALYEK